MKWCWNSASRSLELSRRIFFSNQMEKFWIRCTYRTHEIIDRLQDQLRADWKTFSPQSTLSVNLRRLLSQVKTMTIKLISIYLHSKVNTLTDAKGIDQSPLKQSSWQLSRISVQDFASLSETFAAIRWSLTTKFVEWISETNSGLKKNTLTKHQEKT